MLVLPRGASVRRYRYNAKRSQPKCSNAPQIRRVARHSCHGAQRTMAMIANAKPAGGDLQFEICTVDARTSPSEKSPGDPPCRLPGSDHLGPHLPAGIGFSDGPARLPRAELALPVLPRAVSVWPADPVFAHVCTSPVGYNPRGPPVFS